MLTCGMSEEEYAGIRENIDADNRHKLSVVPIIVAVAWVAMAIVSALCQGDMHAATGLYIMMAAISAEVWVWVRFCEPKNISVSMYIYIILTLFLCSYTAIPAAGSYAWTSVHYVAIVALPLIFTDRPVRLAAVLLLSYAVYVLLRIGDYIDEEAKASIIKGAMYTGASIALGTYMQCVRARRMSYENNIKDSGSTDTLTGIANRSVYNTIADKYKENVSERLVVAYLDVNGLKEVNDGGGHHMGDKLLKDCADCIASVFAPLATCCRTGGDEFVVIGELDRGKIKKLVGQFEEAQKKWREKVNEKLYISIGYAEASEFPDADFTELTRIADSRLYENKEKYYLSMGIDRKDVKIAQKALCNMYDKIILLDLETGFYREVKASISVDSNEKSFESWVEELQKSGDIVYEDAERLKKELEIARLKESFATGGKNLSISFKKQTAEGITVSEIEIIPTETQKDEENRVFLYMKL